MIDGIITHTDDLTKAYPFAEAESWIKLDTCLDFKELLILQHRRYHVVILSKSLFLRIK